MKAVFFDHLNQEPQSMAVQETAIPVAESGQVVIKVHAVSLNPVDWKISSFSLLSFPRVAGLDVAGTIHQIGDEVDSSWKIGDRVCAHLDLRMASGGFAEYTCALSKVLVRIPDGVSFQDASAIPCAGWTAYLALYHRMNIAQGKTLVIAGASGGVGSFAVQLAKLRGVRVIATCSRKNFDFVKQLGADEVIDYNVENIEDRVKELCGPTGPLYPFRHAMLLTPPAMVLAFGGHLGIVVAGPSASTLASNSVFYRCQSLDYVTLGGAYRSADPADTQRFASMGTHMLELLTAGKLKTNVSQTIRLEDIPHYLHKLKEGKAGNGKIVALIA